MRTQAAKNKTAWEYRAYEFQNNQHGSPREEAERIMQNPDRTIRLYSKYFQDVSGLKIANPCGSHGRIATALAVKGASVTVFDISEGNRKYATELAESAGVPLEYVIGDFIETDMARYGGKFDVVLSEGGILHYFEDIDAYTSAVFGLLKSRGRLILNDFHPFHKINQTGKTYGDYFDSALYNGDVAYKRFFPEDERSAFPDCSLRFYTISEIINSVIRAGFVLKSFDEVPDYDNPKIPGMFTIVAEREN
ncbi:MAG: methyltransferase domain-containing protein [Oscillospiraceae bacterium]|jgi:2-polyprenyl-3-methyl-5-hydroxy-6-metoxy-1,4-benzoquinol methylase|nr:methyltransferase domain-containing protein [Oscillospiraceae bacterium]